MAHISIIGSGNVGANTAFFIAETGIMDVRLYDIREGIAPGIALDIMEAAPIRAYRTQLRGVESQAALAGAESIVVAAGRVRGPGMKREDLLNANVDVIKTLAKQIAHRAPQATVIIGTEPVDYMTRLFVHESGLSRTQVMGLGGFLDTTRLRYLIAQELGVSVENVSALVIGQHGDAMIGLPSYCRVSGIPLSQLLSPERIGEIIDETCRAGDLIVELAQHSSAYYAPSAAAAELVDAMHRNLRRIISVSVLLDGEYGLHDVALSLPAVIGREGVVEVLTPQLTPSELERLKASGQAMRETTAEVS